MLTPGFLTDAIGLLLLFPPTRALVRRSLARPLRHRAHRHRLPLPGASVRPVPEPHPDRVRRDGVVDADSWEDPPERSGARVISPVTARPAATIMLLRDAPTPEPALEVLLLRRSGHTPFVPGAHVFPGGAVDPGDHAPRLLDVVEGHDDRRHRRRSTIASGGLAFWIAAVRECLEEAGVLLATHERAARRRRPPVPRRPGLRSAGASRTATTTSARLCSEHGLRLPLDAIAYVSRWVTPEESPRRYDTRFFAAAMPAGQQAIADDWEAVDASWWQPSDCARRLAG